MPRKQTNTRKRVLDTNINESSSEYVQEKSQYCYRSLLLRKTEALDMLNGNSIPTKFRFRDNEIERIKSFVDACLKQQKKGFKFLMITGSPGAGKSLCANTILSKVGCKIIKLNANIVKSLTEVQQIISQTLLGQVQGTAKTALHIISSLQKRQYKEPCAVYIEEIQLLFKAAANPVTEDFMKLFQRKNLNLILIGISNTIDTLQKSSNKFCFKMHDIENVIFPPYSSEHIAQIMKDKIQQICTKTDLNIAISDRLLHFAAQKLQTLKKGDFRICLQFLKGVVHLVFSQADQQADSFIIQISQLNAIFNKMNISKDSLIENLPYQQKVMLIAIYTFMKKTDALLITQVQLQPEVRWICDSLQINYTKQLLSEGLSELEQYGLIEIKKKNEVSRIILKVSLQDIYAVFCDHFIFKKFFAQT